MVLEKTPESPLGSKEIKPVNLKGNQPWVLTGRADVEAEAAVFWSSDANRWLIGKVPDAGKDWGQKAKRATEDEMAGWHHWCNGHDLGLSLGDGEGQGGLACCSPWGHKESDMIGQLANNNHNIVALQYYISFYCTVKWISHMYTCISFFAFPFHLGHHRALSRALWAMQ